MEQSYRSLQVILGAIAIANAALGALLFAQPTMRIPMEDAVFLDGMHLSLAMTVGTFFWVLAGGAFLAALRPRANGGIVLLLLAAHFALLVSDIISLARGYVGLRALLPEMAYFLASFVLLIRFHPSMVPAKPTPSVPSPVVQQEEPREIANDFDPIP